MSRNTASLTNDRPVTDGDKNAANVASQLHDMVQQLCGSAVLSEAKNRAHVLLILSRAANAILHLLAKTVMPNDEQNKPISSTATLFAALLAYHTGPCETEVGKLIGEFSPLVLFDALKDVEKLSGQRPDDRLNNNMCKVARECAADPAMIAMIAKQRSAALRGEATLN